MLLESRIYNGEVGAGGREGWVGDELGLLSLFGTARYEFLGATS